MSSFFEDPTIHIDGEVSAKVGEIISHAFELTMQLDRHAVLQQYVESAVHLTGAQYGALAVLNTIGSTLEFVFTGMSQEQAQKIGNPPQGHGIFADIPKDSYIIINNIDTYMHRAGWPEDHPRMHNMIGLPLRIHEHVYGRLYLCDKEGGFTDTDGVNLQLLSRAAAIAIENARLYAESNSRAQWIAASRAITISLLEGSDEEEALALITREMRRVARADVALIILPSIGETWTCEFADGDNSQELIGIDFPEQGRARKVIRDRTGLIVDSMTRQTQMLVPELQRFGAALYAPMVARGTTQGVIILLRNPDRAEFDLADLSMAENVARQAALALEFAEARQNQQQAMEIEARAQISRDLHDLAIQQLFASGMELAAVREDLEKEETVPHAVIERLDTAIDSIDESVSQIRSIIYSLRDPEATLPVMERLRKEISSATKSLGFVPEFTFSNNGIPISGGAHTEIDDELGSDIADDVVAVVRECLSNTARHAQATHVHVDISIEHHRVYIVVADDGKGIDPEQSRRSGLSNLAARARRHHGTFALRPNKDDSGTRVEWMALIM